MSVISTSTQIQEPKARATFIVFFFQAEDSIRDLYVTGVQTCALPIFREPFAQRHHRGGIAGKGAVGKGVDLGEGQVHSVSFSKLASIIEFSGASTWPSGSTWIRIDRKSVV